MKKSRYTEQQIIGFIKEAEAGFPIADLCRSEGFGVGTFYSWRAKFGGMEMTRARKLIECFRDGRWIRKDLTQYKYISVGA